MDDHLLETEMTSLTKSKIWEIYLVTADAVGLYPTIPHE